MLIVQTLFFGDGGLTTLGANILNIGVISGFTGFYVYKFAKPLGKKARTIVGGFFAGLLSVLFASVAVSLEMWLSGTFPLAEGILFMSLYSALVGVAEGIMTMGGCTILLVLSSKRKKTGTLYQN